MSTSPPPPLHDPPDTVTGRLLAWGAGNRAALDVLLPAMCAELRRQTGHLIRSTALGHEALERLAALDPEQGRLVGLYDFRRLTIEETADALGVPPAVVRRERATARVGHRTGVAGARTVGVTVCARADRTPWR